VKEQSVALTKHIWESLKVKDALDAQGKQFSEIVEKADNELMKALRKFSAKLDDETRTNLSYT